MCILTLVFNFGLCVFNFGPAGEDVPDPVGDAAAAADFPPPPLFFPKTVFPTTCFVFPIFIGGEKFF